MDMAPNNNMDPTLTWEILSRLVSSSTASSNHDGGGGLPFFAQREENDVGASAADDDASRTATAATAASEGGEMGNDGAIFVMACPIRSIYKDDGDGGSCFPSLYSREAIMQEFTHILRLHSSHHGGGRISSAEMGTWMGMEDEDVSLVGSWLCKQSQGRTNQSSKNIAAGCGVGAICKVYNPKTQHDEYALVENLQGCLRERINVHCGSISSNSSSCSDMFCPSLEAMAKQNLNLQSSSLAPIATVTMKQLAQELDLTCEDATWLVDGMLNSDGMISSNISVSTMGGSMVVYNSQVEDRTQYLEKQLLSGLSGVTAPTSLENILGLEDINSQEETATAIISIVKALCQKGLLHGTLSTPSQSASDVNANRMSSLKNAIYTPHIYSHSQRRIADSFYETNGYLIEKKCAALGISRSRMEKFVKESFPDAVLLTNSVIDTGKIIRPLEIAVQNAILNKSFADLKAQLPDDIAAYEDDVREIIEKYLVTFLGEQLETLEAFNSGLSIVSSNVVFFFSSDMVTSCKKLLIPLVEEFSKQRAKDVANDEACKSKRDKKGGISSKLGSMDLIPLLDVARSVGEQYPELLEMHYQYDRMCGRDTESTILWSTDGMNGTNNDGPLVEFCRKALYSDELELMCSRSVKAEVDRLNSTRHGVSLSTRSEGAAKIQNVGDSFESSFRTLCHLLQFFSKSLDTIGSRAQQNNDNPSINIMVNEMKKELLLGCGSCLARLVTEYYLFKNEIGTEGGLLFESPGDNEDENKPASASYFHDVNLATLSFPFFVLKCKENRDPSNYLQSVFPGSPGLSLAQMWDLCSEVGSGAENNIDNEAGKKLELFFSHLESTCLTLTGIPFSKLDKKTERKILATRREGILCRLESSHDKEEVVMCTIVLIYQQVKNLPVAGTKTISSVLGLFEQDKKVPQQVTEALQRLKRSDTCRISDLMTRVKRYGAAKNSKALANAVG